MAKTKKEQTTTTKTDEQGDLLQETKDPNEAEEVQTTDAAKPEKDEIEKRLEEMQKQIAAKDEELKKEREARQADMERANRLEKEKTEAVEKTSKAEKSAFTAQKEAVANALKTAEETLASRKREYKEALEKGDSDGAVEAAEKLAEAKYLHSELKKGSAQLDAYEKQQEELAKQPRQQQQEMSPAVKAWIAKNPRFTTDIEYYNDALAASATALRMGIKPDSPEYFKFVDDKLAKVYKQEDPKTAASEVEDTDPPAAAAPPSRNANNGIAKQINGKTVYKLTAEQRDMARALEMSEVDYAKELMRLKEEGQIQ